MVQAQHQSQVQVVAGQHTAGRGGKRLDRFPPAVLVLTLTNTITGGLRQPFSFVTQEVVEATCQCLLAQVGLVSSPCNDNVM